MKSLLVIFILLSLINYSWGVNVVPFVAPVIVQPQQPSNKTEYQSSNENTKPHMPVHSDTLTLEGSRNKSIDITCLCVIIGIGICLGFMALIIIGIVIIFLIASKK